MKLNDLDLNKLHTFFEVADRGGVSAAAVALGRTRSAVSQSVSGLESALGVRLFDRRGKRLLPTRAGRLLHQQLRTYRTALQRTVDDVVDSGAEIRGLVRLGSFIGFPRARLADFLAAFTVRHPRVEVRVVYAPEADLRARLLANRVDCALAFRAREGVSGRVRAVKLYDQELVLTAAGDLLRGAFDPAALGRTPVVDYYQSDPLIRRWLEHHGHADLTPPVRAWAATTDLVLDLVLRAVGAGVLPRQVAAPYLRDGRLRRVRTGRPELVDSIWLHEPADAHRDPTLTAFREALVDELGRPSRRGAAPHRRGSPASP